MVVKELNGRLGNQLFQYAGVKGILKDLNYEDDDLILCFDKLVYSYGFENDIQHFNIEKYTEAKSFYKKCNIIQLFIIFVIKGIEKVIRAFSKGKNDEFIIYKFEKKIARFLNFFGIYFMRQGYTKFYRNSIFKRKVFIGYYESSKYFDNIKDTLLKEFTPKYPKRKENKELYKKIENSNSICVTIRRGDFLHDEFKKDHYVCTPEYFYKAIELMKEKIKNPTFIVFSDDVEWCKENMNFPKGTQYESGNDPVWEKLRLMYSCKHFIISNSTFSWWAQYLSRNKEKIVIAPKKWKNNGYHDDIYEDGWIKI